MECKFCRLAISLLFLAKWNENRNPKMLQGRTTTVVDNKRKGGAGAWVAMFGGGSEGAGQPKKAACYCADGDVVVVAVAKSTVGKLTAGRRTTKAKASDRNCG